VLDPIIALVSTIADALRGPLFIPAFLTAIGITCYQAFFSNRDKAIDKGVVICAASVVLLAAPKIAASLQGVAGR
jgi:hypothetical protein